MDQILRCQCPLYDDLIRTPIPNAQYRYREQCPRPGKDRIVYGPYHIEEIWRQVFGKTRETANFIHTDESLNSASKDKDHRLYHVSKDHSRQSAADRVDTSNDHKKDRRVKDIVPEILEWESLAPLRADIF